MSLVDDETKVTPTDEVIEDAMNKPVDSEEGTVNEADDSQEDTVATKQDDIVDIQITTPVEEKKKFRLNGDNSRIIELNVNDMGIAGRMSTAYKNLKQLDAKVNSINLDLAEDADDEEIENFVDTVAGKLSELDDEMRKQIDMLFNSPVSEIVAPKGTACMYDPVGGMFRYEHIIETLLTLYGNNLNAEFDKVRARVNKHTSKYTKKKKKY